jgi:hypothetical protein
MERFSIPTIGQRLGTRKLYFSPLHLSISDWTCILHKIHYSSAIIIIFYTYVKRAGITFIRDTLLFLGAETI